MPNHTAHPFGGEKPTRYKLIESIGNTSFRLGILGLLGFFSLLEPVHEVFRVMSLFYILLLALFIPPILGAIEYTDKVLRSDGAIEEESAPTDWMTTGYEANLIKLIQIPAMMIHPTIAAQGMLQLIGSLAVILRHRGRLPTPETHDSDVDYRVPFDGEWTVLSGSPDSSFSHSWFPVQQRYAYDFVKTDDSGQTHDGGETPESFYCFDEPVLAPADGTVVTVKDGHRDYHRTTGWVDPLQYRIAGNYVMIQHDDDEYSFLAHLKKGSIDVSEGQTVRQGEKIGLCGHSGNSTEPHLHFQLLDRPGLFFGASPPIRFSDVTVTSPDSDATREENVFVHCGQTVAPPSKSGPSSS